VDPERVVEAEARIEAWFASLSPDEVEGFDRLGDLAKEAERKAPSA
jgi:hypothetical protein